MQNRPVPKSEPEDDAGHDESLRQQGAAGRSRRARTGRGAAGSRRRAPARHPAGRRGRRSRRRRPRPDPAPPRSRAPDAMPSRSRAACTTMSIDPATVGTTKREPTFSPASSGRVHILVIASRALLAWMVHMPGSPLLSAMSRSRLSAWRTSPTMIREGRMRSASLTRRRSGTSPVPSRTGLAALHRGDVAQRDLELEDLLARDDPLARRDRGGRQLSSVVLPA